MPSTGLPSGESTQGSPATSNTRASYAVRGVAPDDSRGARGFYGCQGHAHGEAARALTATWSAAQKEAVQAGKPWRASNCRRVAAASRWQPSSPSCSVWQAAKSKRKKLPDEVTRGLQ